MGRDASGTAGAEGAGFLARRKKAIACGETIKRTLGDVVIELGVKIVHRFEREENITKHRGRATKKKKDLTAW